MYERPRFLYSPITLNVLFNLLYFMYYCKWLKFSQFSHSFLIFIFFHVSLLFSYIFPLLIAKCNYRGISVPGLHVCMYVYVCVSNSSLYIFVLKIVQLIEKVLLSFSIVGRAPEEENSVVSECTSAFQE